MNNILTTDDIQRTPDESRLRVPGSIHPGVLKDIHESSVWKSWRLEESTMALCATLDQQLALGDAIQFHIKDPELNRVVILFKWCWDCNIKESKCHINEIVTPTFFQCVETPSAFQPVRKWVRRYVLPPSFRRPIFLPVPCGRRSMWLTGPMVRPTGQKNVADMAIDPMLFLAVIESKSASWRRSLQEVHIRLRST